MISRVTGQIVEVGVGRAVVDVAGVGYELLMPQPVLEKLSVGSNTTLLTYHHVRENAQELYGFDEIDAKALFEQLLGVSGVGPKSALAIMSLGDQQRLRTAIANEDAGFIAAASGVGKRSAERVIVELKDKVGEQAGVHGAPAGDDAVAALMALGYSTSQAVQALKDLGADLSTEARVKAALRKLA